ncbi:MAG: hypothetical protein D6690_14425 [Nitrospirae bacterium]|nr:MAG: hypothetical protein D6690_14425 [Nitrospirota bacterium]
MQVRRRSEDVRDDGTILEFGVKMPVDNNFQHAAYSRSDPGERVNYLQFDPGPEPGSAAWRQTMSEAGVALSQAGVRGVLFVHDSPFTDLFGVGRLDEVGGLKRGYSRGIPGLESLLALMRPETNGLRAADEDLAPPFQNDDRTKEILDRLTGDRGNFSFEYVRQFHQALTNDGELPIVTDRYVWSGCRYHLGRVEAALDLLEFLEGWTRPFLDHHPSRIILQAHGHAGLVVALLSNFLAKSESPTRETIFDILMQHYEAIGAEPSRLERLEAIYRQLSEGNVFKGLVLDVVTYGTPVRYGWELESLGQLLHIIYHRPIRGKGKPWLAKMELPQIAWEVPMVAGGDYVQQLAVAGTDAVPLSPDEVWANEELRVLLEPYDGFERWLECARRGTRCHNDGQCLLIDYQVPPTLSPREHFYGHGHYTQVSTMLFHTQQIVDIFLRNLASKN